MKNDYFLRYLSFCPNFYDMQKLFYKKVMVNFKIYDTVNWITNNYNTHIAQYLKKERQSRNEIWSVNRIKCEKYIPI